MSETARRNAAAQIITGLPVFGNWVAAISDYTTPHGHIGARQLEVLWALRHGLYPESPVTASTIANFHSVQPSVVTRVVSKLEASGFVERIGLARDRRANEIRITEPGMAISRFVEEIYYQEVLSCLADFSDEEVEQLGMQAARLHQIGVRLLTERKQRQATHQTFPEPDATEDRPSPISCAWAGKTLGGEICPRRCVRIGRAACQPRDPSRTPGRVLLYPGSSVNSPHWGKGGNAGRMHSREPMKSGITDLPPLTGQHVSLQLSSHARRG